jgi:hypothetical protein
MSTYYDVALLENLPKWAQDRFDGKNEVRLPYCYGRRLDRKHVCGSCGSLTTDAPVPADKDFVKIEYGGYEFYNGFGNAGLCSSALEFLQNIPDETAAQIEERRQGDWDCNCGECGGCVARFLEEVKVDMEMQEEFYQKGDRG